MPLTSSGSLLLGRVLQALGRRGSQGTSSTPQLAQRLRVGRTLAHRIQEVGWEGPEDGSGEGMRPDGGQSPDHSPDSTQSVECSALTPQEFWKALQCRGDRVKGHVDTRPNTRCFSSLTEGLFLLRFLRQGFNA